jgi:hypothetical protein
MFSFGHWRRVDFQEDASVSDKYIVSIFRAQMVADGGYRA